LSAIPSEVEEAYNKSIGAWQDANDSVYFMFNGTTILKAFNNSPVTLPFSSKQNEPVH
jgi:hypothetical protein